MAKKILLSVLSGLLILLVSWKYQNYDFSFSVEDTFLKKIFLWKDKIYSSPPKKKAEFIFVNTGKDQSLVEDTVEYGNVAVSDRQKIYQFVRFINSLQKKPAYTVLDIQFYYPFTPDLSIDTLLAKELYHNDGIVIPVVKGIDGSYKKPLYDANYAYSDYRTFGQFFNKFRIMNQGQIKSIPIILHQSVNKAVYEDHFLYSTCNGRFCLSAIWPSYYLKNTDIGGLYTETDIQELKKSKPLVYKPSKISAQLYNIGEMLFDIEANPESYAGFFNNKIVIMGNFEQDIHSTPVGKMTGPVLLANIYLSLLNRQHVVNLWFLLMLVTVFSVLSYVAWFKKMPEMRWNFKFLFSSYLIKFIKKYITYFGCMFAVSLLALILFNVQVALFLPSFIFTGIEFISQKKYMAFLKPRHEE